MSERVEVELDQATVAYLRQRCVRRGDLAAVAAAALREMAVNDAVRALERWHRDHPDYAELADQEYEQALTQTL